MPKSKNIPIKYTSRDFESIKKDLIEHAKRFYPDDYNDFSESSFGSLMFDTVAYVGDVLSYYLDYSVNESFLDTAIEFNNVKKHAKNLGYKFNGIPVAEGILTFYIKIPAAVEFNKPDTDYFPILKKGSEFSSNNGTVYTLLEDVNFADPQFDRIAIEFDDNGGTTYFAIRAFGMVSSGKLYSVSIDLTDETFEKFRKVRIDNGNVSEVIKVEDSEGNRFYEVDYLSQETIFLETTNQSALQDGVRSIIKPFVTARRFTVYQDNTGTFLQFGFGSENDDDAGLVDPSKVALNMHAKEHITHKAIDPTKLLSTDKLGISPQGTILTVNYKKNVSANPSAAVNTIKNINNSIFKFINSQNLMQEKIDQIQTSLECSNEKSFTAPSFSVTTEELKVRSKNFFATQNRAVTKQDYEAIAYNMPNKFGSLKRVNIINNPFATNKELVMYVISANEQGHLVQSNSITADNLKTWLEQYSSINDIIKIKHAKIINFSIDFVVKTDNRYDTTVVLADSIQRLKDNYTEAFYIGEPLYINDIYNILSKTEGVIDVVEVKINNRSSNDGSGYSSIPFIMDDILSNDATYYKAPKNVIFELKYPDDDISGRAS